MRLLIVEDDKKISRAVKLGFELEGFAVDIAETGTYGYDMANTTPYDAIILDVMLPEMDGLKVCRKLTCGSLVINTQTYEVTRSGTPITLTKREFSLLEYLVKNKNKLVKKEEIINHV